MHEDVFWSLIEKAAKPEKGATKASSLQQLISELPAPQIENFQRLFDGYMQESESDALWAAARLMHGGSCSDDCFTYFRYWLISMGKSVYGKALKDPDSLAAVPVPVVEGRPAPEDEDFGYVARDTYKQITGKELSLFTSEKKRNYRTPEFAARTIEYSRQLPRLWKKYEKYLISDDEFKAYQARLKVNSIELPGLGKVGAGTKLRHRTLGDGVVESVDPQFSIAIVRFDDGNTRSVRLDATIFSKP